MAGTGATQAQHPSSPGEHVLTSPRRETQWWELRVENLEGKFTQGQKTEVGAVNIISYRKPTELNPKVLNFKKELILSEIYRFI